MRKLIRCFLIFFVFLLSFCSLKNDHGDTPSTLTIVGTWYWQKSSGGFSGKEVITPESTGVDKKLVFDTHNEVTVFTNDTQTGKYIYTITMGNSIFDAKEHYLLNFNGMNYVIQYIDNKNLSIQDNFVDGYVLTYVR